MVEAFYIRSAFFEPTRHAAKRTAFMRLSFLRWFALCLLLSTASFARAQYMAGDYGSWAIGAWNTLSTWRVYDGVS